MKKHILSQQFRELLILFLQRLRESPTILKLLFKIGVLRLQRSYLKLQIRRCGYRFQKFSEKAHRDFEKAHADKCKQVTDETER